jgi:hypothetical protein
VETQLQNVASRDGIGGDVAEEVPWLLPALGRLEHTLARLLVDFWEAKAMPASERPVFVPRLEALAAEMRQAAGMEWNLVAELQNTPGAKD